MKIVNIKCPSCGNSLDAKNTDEFIECEYCHNKVYLDDDKKKIEINFKFNNNRENANAYLYKFKEYDKSKTLYYRLLSKNVDDKELWLGYLLSITHEFTKKDYYIYERDELLNAWNHYSSLANTSEKKKYESKVNKIIDDINQKILDKKADNDKKNKKIKLILKLFLVVVVLFIGIIIINPHFIKKNKINASELSHYCNSIDSCDMSSIVKKLVISPFSRVSVAPVKFDTKKTEYDFNIAYKNLFVNRSENKKFIINDDIGPIIFGDKCSTYEDIPLDYNQCLKIYDLTDGYISTENIESNLSNSSYKVGDNEALIKVKDKEGNESTKNIMVTILPTPIEKFDIVIEDKIEINKELPFEVSILPENIKDKSYEINYDNDSLEKISDNFFKTKKVGQSEICIISNYDKAKKSCKKINIIPECKKEYLFEFSGSKEEKISTNIDFCEGTYKIYAPEVLNKNGSYHVYQYNNGNLIYVNNMLIWKTAGSLNDEGQKFVLSDNSYLEVSSGILKLKLVKVS